MEVAYWSGATQTRADQVEKGREKTPLTCAAKWLCLGLCGVLWGAVVSMLLTGTFSRSIDEKLRVAIPKRLRDALECLEGAVLYVAPGTDQSLALYTEEAFARLADRLGGVSPTRQDVRAFTRLFYARAQRVELDRQGRIRIPPELAKLAALEKDAVLLGVHDHLELWAAKRWESYLTERQSHYDQLAESALGGGQQA
jgi:MraZ protein